VPVKEIRATGLEAQALATELLQRIRRVDPLAGLWEAADIQWWWRTPRPSDQAEKLFWIDDEGPVAAVLLTSWTNRVSQCDPIVVPGVSSIEPGTVWNRALDHAAIYAPEGFDIPIGDDDRIFKDLALQSGLTAGDQDSTGWMDAMDRPAVIAPADGFVITDRTQRQDAPHPLRGRNGKAVAQRLAQCSLYDPALDISVETAERQVAGYILFWFDPVTRVGLVEPVRVEDEFQRRGLARAMLTTGIDKLAAKGAQRLKISWESETAGALYLGVGFQKTSSATWYRQMPG
jgi:predicted N-acetyltransferase YhbS